MTGFGNESGSPSGSITIYLSNSYGASFAGNKEISAGTTIGDLFRQECGDADPDLFMIRHNGDRDPSSNTVLVDNDTVSFTPVKIKGAG